jgi:hypothetical protein
MKRGQEIEVEKNNNCDDYDYDKIQKGKFYNEYERIERAERKRSFRDEFNSVKEIDMSLGTLRDFKEQFGKW